MIWKLMEVMEDRVHVFLCALPRYSPAQVMQIMKGLSVRDPFAQFPWLRGKLRGSLLTDRHYHYLPDQIPVELIRREELDPVWSVGYGPLTADPDSLLLDSCGKKLELCDEVIPSGQFRSVHAIPNYMFYECPRR